MLRSSRPFFHGIYSYASVDPVSSFLSCPRERQIISLLDMVLSLLACLDLQEESCLLLDTEVSHSCVLVTSVLQWDWVAEVLRLEAKQEH